MFKKARRKNAGKLKFGKTKKYRRMGKQGLLHHVQMMIVRLKHFIK